jgi:polyglycine hydrolase-like protein
VKKPPETWFWSHDIKSTQIDSVVMPGTRLMRLSAYGGTDRPRFAALIYKDAGPERRYALDLDAAALAARLHETGERPIAITAGPAGDGGVRFSVVLETGPGPLSSVHVDLDEAGVCARLDDQHCIADLATYTVAGARRFAAIVEERTGPSWLFVGVPPAELDAKLLELGAALVRLRGYVDGGVRRLAAVAERVRVAGWAWYADLDADGVARKLEDNAAYPVDLDAVRDDRGVRFTVVMYRQR